MSTVYSGYSAAIAGTGFMAWVHAEALRRIGVPIVGILGSSLEKGIRASQKLGIPTAYPNWDSLLQDPSVSVVHVTTPNRHHYPMAESALKAGKHVLCEKPLAMSSAESQCLVELAKDLGLAAGVNYNIRFYPLNQEARQSVQDGFLGQVFSVTGSYTQDWLLKPTDYNWRVLATEGGPLRAVADIGTHWMDLVQNVSGLKIESVFADLQTIHPVRKRPAQEVETFSGKVTSHEVSHSVRIDTEDMGLILMRFQGGARGSLFVSQTFAGRKNALQWEMAGSQSSLSWNSEKPNELWRGYRDRPNEILMRDPGLAGAWGRRWMDYPGGHNEGFPDSFKMAFRAFYDALIDGSFATHPVYPTFEEGHREILLCEAILKSHQEQRWISL